MLQQLTFDRRLELQALQVNQWLLVFRTCRLHNNVSVSSSRYTGGNKRGAFLRLAGFDLKTSSTNFEVVHFRPSLVD